MKNLFRTIVRNLFNGDGLFVLPCPICGFLRWVDEKGYMEKCEECGDKKRKVDL